MTFHTDMLSGAHHQLRRSSKRRSGGSLLQSVAGTEAANRSFGITLAMLREGRERVQEHHRQRGVPWKEIT
jgi:ethanolamine ammonia-lyase large subunit